MEARGYFAAEGRLQVPAEGAAPSLEIGLRPLSEATPAFFEGSRSTILRWLEKGNNLLAQERWAEARDEYGKALAVLPAQERPQVLQAVARAHFMEGDVDAAIERLQEALVLAPEDAELRTLFLSVLKSSGRSERAEELLAEVEQARARGEPEKPGAEQIAAAAPTRREPELGPMIEASPHRTGRFRTAFSERSPWSGIEVFLERYGGEPEEIAAADPRQGSYDLSAESFELFVPESYAPERPHGVFVWLAPIPFGGFTSPELAEVLAARRLIWAGANRAGNRRATWNRVGLALDAVHNLERLFSIDRRRVYVAGYSGGGRLASSLSMLFPEVFSGAFPQFGCDYFEPVAVPDRPGALWPARFPPPRDLARLKREGRFVLLTGERDFNRSQTWAISERMLRDGFERVTYLEIPSADHYHGFDREWFERGIEALDAQPTL